VWATGCGWTRPIDGPLEDEAEPKSQPWQHGPLLPVKVVLRDFAAQGLPAPGQPATVKDLLDFITADLVKGGLADFVAPLRQSLQQGRGLLLLDGLDEVPEAGRRRSQIKEAVEGFAASYPNCRILVTSRTYAYQKQDWRLPGFAEAVLANFSQGQIRRFVERWYAHAAAQGRVAAVDAPGRAELLQRAIFENSRLRELAERPLLLTLMASLHAWGGGSLPDRREELYDRAVELLLDTWEGHKIKRDAQKQIIAVEPSLSEWLKLKDKNPKPIRNLLNRLAFAAHAGQPELEGTADVPGKDLVYGLLNLREATETDVVNPAHLLDYLNQRAGLILPKAEGIYTFPHRTFQEYLAACHLTEAPEADFPHQVADLARAEPNRWREVALLAGAKAARGTPAAVWLLADALCFRQAPEGAGNVADAWGALLAGQLLAETIDLTHIHERYEGKVERLRAWLVNILENGHLPATERALAGRTLAHLGDPRPGVGLRADGLPDITTWVKIEGGTFLRGEAKEEVTLPTFNISRYPVTNAQFQAFVEDGAIKTRIIGRRRGRMAIGKTVRSRCIKMPNRARPLMIMAILSTWLIIRWWG
jgi:hypothetical protein